MENVISVDFKNKNLRKIKPLVNSILEDYGFDPKVDRIPMAAIECATDEAIFQLEEKKDNANDIATLVSKDYKVIPYSI